MWEELPTRALSQRQVPEPDESVSGLIEEMVRRVGSGERLAVEEIFARHPELAEDSETALRLIYEEYCLRQEKGESVTPEQFLARFPRWRAQLEALLDCHRLLLPPSLSPDEVRRQAAFQGRFVIVGELGRGANGPVFLATDPALADRPVVLKVIPLDGREHLTLARLQHTHIVPLYAVIDLPEEQRRILCMPYLGGATLAQILEALKDTPVAQRTGQHILTALDQVQARFSLSNQHAECSGDRPLLPLPIQGPVRKTLARDSWTEVVCWMGVRLAKALHYAHERGLVHLDVKPSNILLTADGQPMLLDFHIAQKPIQTQGPSPEWLGGTPGYASPEQQAALAALTLGADIPQTVDGRSDVYSLGLVLYRLLGGTVPLRNPASVPPLDRINPRVSVGLADIVARCLSEDPEERYPSAQTLTQDLQRHLDHLPLLGVRNRSWRESWRKWRHRDPFSLRQVLMTLAVLAALGTFLLVAWEESRKDRHKAETYLAEGQAHFQGGRYDEARKQLAQGLQLCRFLPGSESLSHSLEQQLRVAQRAHEVGQFHQLVDRLRFAYGGNEHRKGIQPALQTHAREVWRRRNELLDPQAKLTHEVEDQLQTDLLDLAIIWADLRLRSATGSDTDIEESVRLLRETETLFGESQVLCRLRQAGAQALHRPAEARQYERRADSLTPKTAWEHYALGRWWLGQGKLGQAATAFEEATDLPSAGFWPFFYQGVCAHQRGEFEDAIQAFRVCIALTPRSGPSYYNRALAEEALDRREQALRDYTRALEADPDLAEAALNRGVLHFREKRYEQASADLHRALDRGASADQVYYNLALVRLEQQDRSAALAHVRSALKANPSHPEALELARRLQP